MAFIRSRFESAAQSWIEWLKLALPLLLIVTAVFYITWKYVRPAPPQRVVMATGVAGGVYDRAGRLYSNHFSEQGFELALKPTAGSVENYRLLQDPASGVDVALVQSGLAPSPDTGLRAIASVYFEPLWVFYRAEAPVSRLAELAGKRMAIGPEGSGVRALAIRLLQENGVKDAVFSEQGGAAALEALKQDKVDAAMLVSGADNPLLTEFLRVPGVRLMSFAGAEGYARRFPFLSHVTLYQGSLDLAANLPSEDTHLVAPAAMIVARRNIHTSTVELLIQAAREAHAAGTLLNEPGVFPTGRFVDLPLDRDAAHFLKTPPNILQRSLPFWLAALIGRLLILLLPAVAVLLPLLRVTPIVYRWRMRSRIYRWYGQLRRIDAALQHHTTPETLQADLQELAALDKELGRVKVPLSFMQELYILRTHVAYLRGRVEKAVQ